MKIIIINTSDSIGGAAIAAKRLQHALHSNGIEAKLLVRDKQSNNKEVEIVTKNRLCYWMNRLRFYWERFIIYLHNHFCRKKLFEVSIANTGIDLSKHPLIKEADVIHLHWINQGFLSLMDIKKLTELGKPIVWTMHDMWPATGICHHARQCIFYQSFCHSCDFLNSNKKDLSTKVFREKQSIYKSASISFVGCSRWIMDQACKSTLLNDKNVKSIPNPIDQQVFHPIKQSDARRHLSLPPNKKLLLFGALNITDKRKGIDYLLQALAQMPDEGFELVVFGQVKDDIRTLVPVPIHTMGYIDNTLDIVMLYSAVDVFVTSSLEENLPNTIMESMACGTPCVGFNTGGIPEMIDHKINGYVANYKDSDDLAEGIRWILSNPDMQNLSGACLEKVNREYAQAVVAKKYIELYKQIIFENE